MKRALENRTFNTVTPNTTPNQIKNVQYGSVLRTKDFVPHKYKQ